jgi:hypothetical protein
VSTPARAETRKSFLVLFFKKEQRKKNFFFEKKKQKTFVCWARRLSQIRAGAISGTPTRDPRGRLR